jgi:hypothetical protein
MIPRKQVFLFSILFLVLTVSLLYYILPRVRINSRFDQIPSNAYIVPWMKPNPSIEELNQNPQLPGEPPPFDLDAVMTNALKLSMTFTINVSVGARIVPSTVYLGHDSDHLYIGGKFSEMYTNPASDPTIEILPNYFQILFDVADDGTLNQPESGSRLSVFITPQGTWMWGYHDMVWAYSRSNQRMCWYLAENFYSPISQPASALVDVAVEYDNSTGTLTMLFSRFLNCSLNSRADALQMKPDERWVMGFLLELGYATHISSFGDYVDGWPRKAYPYPDNNSSWWPKLAIDLSNPPPSFSV